MSDEWKKVTLGDVATIQTGVAKNEGYSGETIEIPYLRVANVQDGFLDLSEIKKIKIPVEKKNRFLLQKGDVIMTEGGDFDKLGRGTIWDGQITPCAHQNHLFAVRTDCTKLNPFFLSYLSASSYGRLYFRLSSKQSTNLASINSTQLSLFPILLPSLEEQKRIVDTISIWDSAIEKTEKLISEKEKKLQWIIIHYFEAAEGNKNWIVSKLSEFLKPGDKHPVENTANYRKITIKLHKNGIEYINSQRKMADTRPFYIRRAGELIIGKQNYFNGSIALLEKNFDGAICSNAIMSFSIAKSVNPDFLLEAISTKKYLREKSVYANGTGQKELSENAFLNFDVKLPSLKVQNEIMKIVNLQKSEISLLKKQLEQYKLQKQGLMQKLLSGEWRVK